MSIITQRVPYYAMVSKDKHNVRYSNKIDTHAPLETDRQHLDDTQKFSPYSRYLEQGLNTTYDNLNPNFQHVY